MEKIQRILRISQNVMAIIAITTFYTTLADFGLIYVYRILGIKRLYLMAGALVLAAGLWLARFLLFEEVIDAHK